ncbi:hypothetical protein [Paractinoplanes deccanensis]|uniref:hypothetical protein n=1 Tax=Paractinoplanes deccanensis TaxID=113561 RepID=UPI001EF23AA8|nr:hypothetical protein [Actinoplanes deccanensis]
MARDGAIRATASTMARSRGSWLRRTNDRSSLSSSSGSPVSSAGEVYPDRRIGPGQQVAQVVAAGRGAERGSAVIGTPATSASRRRLPSPVSASCSASVS